MTEPTVISLIERQPQNQIKILRLGSNYPSGILETPITRNIVNIITRRCQLVEELFLMNCGLIEEDLTDLMKNCPYVEQFGLLTNRVIDITIWDIIAKYWQLRKVQLMKSIDGNGLRFAF